MANELQYKKDGKIYSSLMVGWNNGDGVFCHDLEVCNLTNEFEVECEFCHKTCKPGEAQSDSGNCGTGEITSWSCKQCDDASEAAYAASCFDVDYRESMLAEGDY